MTLYDLLQATVYDQQFAVYVNNIYDQNILVGAGVRAELLDESENELLFDHLMDKVDMLRVSKDGKILVVFVVDKNYKKRAEKLYQKEYVKRWDARDEETRPYRYLREIIELK